MAFNVAFDRWFMLIPVRYHNRFCKPNSIRLCEAIHVNPTQTAVVFSSLSVLLMNVNEGHQRQNETRSQQGEHKCNNFWILPHAHTYNSSVCV